MANMTLNSLKSPSKSYNIIPLVIRLILRIAVADPTAQCPLATKYGCDPYDEAPQLLKSARQMGLQIIGISFHVGSGCRDPSAFRLAIQLSRQLFQLGLSLGHPMAILDIGGGFPGHDTKEITFAEVNWKYVDFQ